MPNGGEVLVVPDGGELAGAGFANVFSIKGQEISKFRIPGHYCEVSSDGKVVVGVRPGKIVTYDTESKGDLQIFEVGHVTQMAIVPNSHLIAIGMNDGEVRLITSSSGEVRTRLGSSHPVPVKYLGFSPDGSAMAVIHGQVIHVLELNGASNRTRIEHSSTVHCAAFSPSGGSIAYGTHDGGISIVNRRTQSTRTLENTGLGWVRKLAFSPDGKILAGLCNVGIQRKLRFWSMATDQVLHTSGSRFIPDFSFSPDGKYVAVLAAQSWTVYDLPKLLEIPPSEATGATIGRDFADGSWITTIKEVSRNGPLIQAIE